MAATIYGATLFKSPTNPVNFASNALGDNSEVFTSGDPVTIEVASGTLAIATNGATAVAVAGIVQKTATMASDNETVAKVRPSYIPMDQDYIWLMGTNTDLAEASIGQYYKLTGTTGAVQVDVTSGAQTTTSRVVECVGIDPNNLGGSGSGSGLRQGLFKFVNVENLRTSINS